MIQVGIKAVHSGRIVHFRFGLHLYLLLEAVAGEPWEMGAGFVYVPTLEPRCLTGGELKAGFRVYGFCS